MDDVPLDLRRLLEAIHSPTYQPPTGLTREQIREFIIEQSKAYDQEQTFE